MLKAIFKPIVILGLQPTRVDQQLLIQNYSSSVFVEIPPNLGHSAPFLLYLWGWDQVQKHYGDLLMYTNNFPLDIIDVEVQN